MTLLPSLSEFSAALPAFGRLLGFDVGEKTIGLALSDGMRTIASPYETIRRTKFSKDVEILRKIVREFEIGGFVLGYPINMNGTEGPRCQSTRQFAKNLDAVIPLPMMLWDERMSTMAVERAMLEADMSRAKRAANVDKLAATYILQGALDGMGRV